MPRKRLGAFAVFDKPFDVNDLRTVALHVIGEENALRAARSRKDR